MHNVPGDDLADGRFPADAVAHNVGGDADHGFEFGGRRIRPGFLNETQGEAERDHQEHYRTGPNVSGDEGENSQDGQENDERVSAGGPKPVPPGMPLFARYLVGSVFGQSSCGLGFRQAGFGSLELFQRFRGGRARGGIQRFAHFGSFGGLRLWHESLLPLAQVRRRCN